MTNRNGTNNGDGVHSDAAIGVRNGNGHQPGSAIIEGHELLWDGLSPAVTNALNQPLDPGLVSQRKGRGGRVFDYLEGHVVIDQANAIFGYGAWGVELVGDVTLRRIESVDAQTGEVKVSHAYSAPVRVTVAGALPRTDVGFHAVTEETPEGHETACKGAVTDGMKRALRTFGGRFGNSLYGDRQPVVNPPRPEREPVKERPQGRSDSQVEPLRNRLMELAAQQGFDEKGVRTAVHRQTGKRLDDLTPAELGPLVEAAANKLRQMRQAQAA